MRNMTGHGLTGVAKVQATMPDVDWFIIADQTGQAAQLHEVSCSYCDSAMGDHCAAGMALYDLARGLFALGNNKF